MAKVYTGTGRRKSSIAQVKMVPGKGKITVNGRDVREFFPYETNVMDLKQPLVATNNENTFDIARALLEYDAPNEGNEGSYRQILKRAGFITRDSRAKERKKPGLKAARRAPQFSKR